MDYIASNVRYSQMRYRRCGKSGLVLPEISLGLWHNFGHTDDFENCRDIIFQAFDSGITHFDLANNYGPPIGAAEENFGKIFKSNLLQHRDEIIISSKAGYKMWEGPYGDGGSRKYLIASCNQSLKRMGIEYVDVFYSHRYDANSPIEETMSALDYIVRSGKALYAGISNYNPEQTKKAVEILNQLGTPCLIHQAKYSMLARTPEQGLLDVLGDKGVGFIAFSPLAQGLLTNRYLHGVPLGSRVAGPSPFLNESNLTNELLVKLKNLSEIAIHRGQSLAQMAIAWLLRDERVTSVLVGASSSKQLTDSIGALNNTRFTNHELVRIDEILGSK